MLEPVSFGKTDQTVSIQYKERKTGRRRTCRLSGDEFMRRFLQHVLPRGFHKVRYYGPVASRATPQRRSGAADAATSSGTQGRPAAGACPVTRATWRGANAADRAADLSALSSRPADLHPRADAAAGDGTMTGSARRCPASLPRAPTRHRDLLSQPQPTILTSASCCQRLSRKHHAGPRCRCDAPQSAPVARRSSAWAPSDPAEISIEVDPTPPHPSNGASAAAARRRNS